KTRVTSLHLSDRRSAQEIRILASQDHDRKGFECVEERPHIGRFGLFDFLKLRKGLAEPKIIIMRYQSVLLDEHPLGEAQPFRSAQVSESGIAGFQCRHRVFPLREARCLAEIAPYTEKGGLLDDGTHVVQKDAVEPLWKLRCHDHRDDAAA